LLRFWGNRQSNGKGITILCRIDLGNDISLLGEKPRYQSLPSAHRQTYSFFIPSVATCSKDGNTFPARSHVDINVTAAGFGKAAPTCCNPARLSHAALASYDARTRTFQPPRWQKGQLHLEL